MRCRFLLFLICCLLAWSRRVNAQDQSRPFIKISHIGAEEQPVYGAFISTRPSTLDEKLDLMPGYRAEPVFLVSKGQFAVLLRYGRSFAAQAGIAHESKEFGTLQLTFSDGEGSDISIVTTKDDSLSFVAELTVLVDGFAGANRREPALRAALQQLALQLGN